MWNLKTKQTKEAQGYRGQISDCLSQGGRVVEGVGKMDEGI